MTTYLDDFTKKQFTTHSFPEYFSSDFQATQGDGILNEIDHQLLLDINDKIIDLVKIDIQSGCIKNTYDTNFRILGKLKFGLTLATAEKFFFLAHLTIKVSMNGLKNHIKSVKNQTVRLNYLMVCGCSLLVQKYPLALTISKRKLLR